MDQLEASIKVAKFYQCNGRSGNRKKIAGGKPSLNIFFAHWKNKKTPTSKSNISKGIIEYPDLYKQAKKVAGEFFPDLKYNTIQVNKNVQCIPHKDSLNVGPSVIFTLGNFTGGRLYVENVAHDIFKKPLIFNGFEQTHWTEPFEGDRYSFIYYQSPLSNNLYDDITSEQVITKWGYKNEKHIVDQLDIQFRPNTTDEKVINELLVKNVYQKKKIGFTIESDDHWLDLGANIGIFSLHVLSNGGKVISVEPEPENLYILTNNLQNNFPLGGFEIIQGCVSTYNGKSNLYLCNGKYNKYRHSICLGKSNRKSIEVKVINIHEILLKYPTINCIKIDIEGEEINILENINLDSFKNIKKLVFEYSFDADPSIHRFTKIIDRLKSIFTTVHFTGVKLTDQEYKFYPPCINVYCINI